MSVLIKGMKPPKSCYVCSWYNKVPCPVSDGKCYYRNERHPSCPLIELPPHGRLIDADKLKSRLVLDNDSNELQRISADILKWIDIQDTVIEAEGARNDFNDYHFISNRHWRSDDSQG